MASNEYKDLNYILKKTELTDLYPEKLTREFFYELRNTDITDIKYISQLSNVFIQNLKFRYDGSRSLKVSRKGTFFERKRTDSQNLHPLEIIVAVFLCCDAIAKQDCVKLLWECKFAIPFVIQTCEAEKPLLYLWPLRSVLFNSTSNEHLPPERVTTCKTTVVSFVRMSETTVSKSELLNRISCQSDQHSTFFHRDLKASTKIKSFPANGMIEISFASVPPIHDCMFLNLRGDIRKHVSQANLLSDITDVYVIVCEFTELQQSKLIIDQVALRKPTPGIFYIITDSKLDDEKYNTIDNFFEQYKHFTMDLFPLERNPRSDVTERFNEFLESINSTKQSVETTCNMCRKWVKLDEDSDVFNDSKEKVKPLLQFVRTHENAEDLFPLLGQNFHNLNSANQELYGLKNVDGTEVSPKKKEVLNRIKVCRANQKGNLKSENSLIKLFFDIFSHTDKNAVQRQICLRLIKQGLQDLTKDSVCKLQREYTELLYFLSKENDDRKLESLLQVQEKVLSKSVSISNITKEMGQAFEATEPISNENMASDFPEIAVKTLLDGYPLEIMDGKTLSVPIQWISAVLRQLLENLRQRHKRKKIAIKAISVLGIQGTGKSTLLNIMFGAEFEVSSGRCTRGINLQLVKVSQSADWARNADYVLLVDTEGLSAIEHCADISRERELATFVIGLTSLTIVNIMSENTFYLRDILPIAALAFLRMDLVGLDPRCIIVHQNGDKMNKHLLMKQWNDLDRQLNQYTTEACQLEKVSDRLFRDVVHLDIARDIHCIPQFIQRHGTIETISKGYSERVMDLLRAIMNENNTKISDLEGFESHTRLLCDAIKKENFVFAFRNTIEAAFVTTVNRKWCVLIWKLKSSSRTLVSDFEHEISSVRTMAECRMKYETQKELARAHIEEKCSKLVDECKEIIQDESEKYVILKEPSKTKKLQLSVEGREILESVTASTVAELKQAHKRRCRNIRLLANDPFTELEVTEFIRHHLYLNFSVEQSYEIIFRNWISSLSENQHPLRNQAEMMKIAIATLYEAYPSHQSFITEKLNEYKGSISDQISLQNAPVSQFSSANNEEQNLMIRRTIDDLNEKVITFLEHRKTNKIVFNTSVFADLIIMLQSNKYLKKCKMVKRWPFEISIAFNVIQVAIKALKDIENQSSTETPVNLGRERFERIYRRIITCNEDWMEIILSSLKEEIFKQLDITITTHLTNELQTYEAYGVNILMSKQKFKLYMLLQMAKDCNSMDINDYVLRPGGSTRNWLCSVYDDFTGIYAEENDRQSKHWELIQRFIQEQLLHILEEIEHVIHKTIEIKTDKWIQELYVNLKDVLPYLDSDLKYEPFRKNESFVRANIADQYCKLKQEMLVNVTNIFESNYDEIKLKIIASYERNLTGCTEECPECFEICTSENANHADAHVALEHIPTELLNQEKGTRVLNRQADRLTSVQHETWNHECCLRESDCFWKALYAKNYEHIVNHLPVRDRPLIPDSWKQFDLELEISKLEYEIKNNTRHS